ncbi:tRNA (adenosine(37)-N6)-threonylcarbamoyltransferase complex ATPase subunit type 1 TsaE [Bifidobacterium sp. W8109]|uniref:tRNA (adenosine(37)-N6)-threonylcarbamoyltransferase complex ATPase subunit type 1 TsaE n=1 Tax=Bifidobacterium TaxID=1678 RepID=UPI0018DAFB1A|nr:MULTISPECIES: tRNA (adenosine(37)-N6)-threonylcarbamoyltransferase complex ATPase subunit type 1 TsaE [Bifidobacterium]MBH9972022.1 tRNA (adenosine(37)-N6)-threonylcarbamoyltransferase complex ATPase subunit type 1 TsaE [Bifidobacterium asteroides]MBI0073668.1 tRNA (adenosine(37)-N6)-threonylcarbamoyltransferase complex ATPase subunit type 1 TsaE [Bifidobacterium sp. W8110]
MSLQESAGRQDGFRLAVPTDDDMQRLGRNLATCLQGGDVILLSGPLGAGKTTLAQGLGSGLGVDGPVVSPTFTIARELHGHLSDGLPVTLIHVDAYRLGGQDYLPGEDAVDRLLDELESLGLDEELEDPGQSTVILMEWGEQMASALADQRLEVTIDRPVDPREDPDAPPSSQGQRMVRLRAVGPSWATRLEQLRKAMTV